MAGIGRATRLGRLSSLVAALIVALSALVVPAGPAAADDEVVAGRELAADVHDNQILVRFKGDSSTEARAAVLAQGGGLAVSEIRALGVQVVKVVKGSATDAAQRLRQSPEVEHAEVNGVVSVAALPNDARFGELWGLRNVGQNINGIDGAVDADIDATEAWEVTRGSRAVRIAILDTGIATGHPDLTGKVVQARNFSDSFTPADLHGHGTHVAGIAVARANNAAGVAGVCPECSLLNLKVLGDDGRGSFEGIIRAILYAANCRDDGRCGPPRARVINLSLGGRNYSFFLEEAINRARANGVILACAAGNQGGRNPVYPAANRHCIAVAATNNLDQRASFSNFGSWVDVAAPGSRILSTSRTGGVEVKSGTSMATPHVAGLAGLLFSRGLRPDAVRSRIEGRADAIPDTGAARGRINACKAVRNVPRC